MEFTFDQPWRKAFESTSALVWLVGALACVWIMLTAPHNHHLLWLMLTATAGMASYNFGKALRIWYARGNLLGHDIQQISDEELDKKLKKYPDGIWLGWGYDWKPRHSHYLYLMKRFALDDVRAPSWFLWIMLKLGRRFPQQQVGSTWIHGMEVDEKDIVLPTRHLAGNTAIFATTGSMKTRCLELICTETIRKRPRACLIVIDPKGDIDLLNRLRYECKKAGRSFKFFHPAYPDRSVRFDPLKNWTRPTEIATRISSLLPAENEAFTHFAWQAINTIVVGLVYVESSPNLVKLRRYITGGADHLLDITLRTYFQRDVENWEVRVQPYIERATQTRHPKAKPTATTSDELMGMVHFYKTELADTQSSPVVDSLMSAFLHNRDHYTKLIASLMPLLDMLCTGEMESLLSPDPNDSRDLRPIVDIANVIDSADVLFIGLDSLSDSSVGEAIGSIAIADITAVCGDRYNYSLDDRKINVVVDEASEVVNSRPFVQLLNKGRGAGVNVIFASQSLPDYIAKTGDDAVARQILANANNLIVGRTRDNVTAEYCVETFGTTFIKGLMHTQNTNMGSENGEVAGFASGYGERLIESKEDLFPPETLGQIPNLEYIAALSGGHIMKGRLPVLEKIPESELLKL